MTTMRLVPNSGDELPSQVIARRIRGLMGEHRVTGVKLAEAIGMDQASFSRRHAGHVDWTINELARVAAAFDLTFAELVAVEIEGVRHQGLEPRTRWLTALPASWRFEATA